MAHDGLPWIPRLCISFFLVMSDSADCWSVLNQCGAVYFQTN